MYIESSASASGAVEGVRSLSLNYWLFLFRFFSLLPGCLLNSGSAGKLLVQVLSDRS